MNLSNKYSVGLVSNLALLLAAAVTLTCGDGDEDLVGGGKNLNVEMVLVEGGSLMLGCTPEQGSDCLLFGDSVYTATVSDFYIGKYPVTQKLWFDVMGTTASQQCNDSRTLGIGNQYPIYCVSWDDAQEFISELNRKTGKTYRLPNNSEWEYAARGGQKTKGYVYAGGNVLDEVGWYFENSGDNRLNENSLSEDDWGWGIGSVYYSTLINNNNQVHPVGRKKPNELGIYDMSGNVGEWIVDRSDMGFGTSSRIARGLSWSSWSRRCQVSYIGLRWGQNSWSWAGWFPWESSDAVGFRLVLDP